MKHLLNAEWKRIWYPRFTKKYSIAMIVIGIITGLALSLTTRLTQQKTLAELTAFEVIAINLLSLDVMSCMLIIFSSMMVAREFSSGSMRTALLVMPHRMKLMTARLLIYILFSLCASVTMSLLAFSSGQLLLLINGLPTASFLDHSIAKIVLGSISMPVFYTAISICFAFLLRSAGGAMIASFAIMFLPILAKVMDETLQALFIPLLPPSAIHSIAGIATSAEQMPILAAASVLLIWLGLIFALGIGQFNKKDI